MQININEEFEKQLTIKITKIIKQALNSLETNQKPAPEWFDISGASKYVGVSRNTMNSWINQGLKITIIGGSKRIKKSDLNEFMLDHSI